MHACTCTTCLCVCTCMYVCVCMHVCILWTTQECSLRAGMPSCPLPIPTPVSSSHLLSWHSYSHCLKEHNRRVQVSGQTNGWKLHFSGKWLLVTPLEKFLSFEIRWEFPKWDATKMADPVGGLLKRIKWLVLYDWDSSQAASFYSSAWLAAWK